MCRNEIRKAKAQVELNSALWDGKTKKKGYIMQEETGQGELASSDMEKAKLLKELLKVKKTTFIRKTTKQPLKYHACIKEVRLGVGEECQSSLS